MQIEISLDIITKEVKVEILLQYFNFFIYLSKSLNLQKSYVAKIVRIYNVPEFTTVGYLHNIFYRGYDHQELI